jgi:hypothetical protein
MHRATACVILVLVMPTVALSSWPCEFGRARESLAPLETAWEDAVAQVNAVRVAAGLQPVVADTALCYAVRGHIRYAVEKGGVSLAGEADWAEQLHQAIPHSWRSCFYAVSDSVSGAVSALIGDPAFHDSATYPDASHIAVATGTQAGLGSWCAGCTFRRLVELGRFAFYQTFMENGYGSTAFCGTSRYPYVRATITESREEAVPDELDSYSEELDLDDNGCFTVAIPMSRTGSSSYDVVLYVSDNGTDYEVAADLRVLVPKATPGSF